MQNLSIETHTSSRNLLSMALISNRGMKKQVLLTKLIIIWRAKFKLETKIEDCPRLRHFSFGSSSTKFQTIFKRGMCLFRCKSRSGAKNLCDKMKQIIDFNWCLIVQTEKFLFLFRRIKALLSYKKKFWVILTDEQRLQ